MSLAGPRGGAVGRGTAQQVWRSQVRFPMVSLEFFIDIILPAALWPWGWLSRYQKWVSGIFPGGLKAAGAYGWQPYHLHVPIVLKYESLILLKPSGAVLCLTFTFFTVSLACFAFAVTLIYDHMSYFFRELKCGQTAWSALHLQGSC